MAVIWWLYETPRVAFEVLALEMTGAAGTTTRATDLVAVPAVFDAVIFTVVLPAVVGMPVM